MGIQSSSECSFAGEEGIAQTTYDREDIMVCSALAMYNALLLLTLIFAIFERRRGLYFWSLSLASFGIIPYCVGWLIDFFNLTPDWAGMILAQIGWTLLVSGQSMVLYSRLHLVLRVLLWMIIVNGIIWHTSITVLVFGSNYSPVQNQDGFNAVFNVLEKVQMTCFCVQEFILSGFYIWKTWELLGTTFGCELRFIRQLFAINVFIVAMDIALLAIEYKSLFLWKQGVKAVTYSIKLKLEFAILGQLVEFVKHRGRTASVAWGDNVGACCVRGAV